MEYKRIVNDELVGIRGKAVVAFCKIQLQPIIDGLKKVSKDPQSK